MSTLLAGPAPVGIHDEKAAGRALESLLVKQLLQSSGVFKGTGAAGSSLHADLFAEAIAEAVVSQGGFGVGDAVAKSVAPPAGAERDPSDVKPLTESQATETSSLSPLKGDGQALALPGGTPAKPPVAADPATALKVYRRRADE
ncbi:MAG: hypothetical protein RL653_1711 [Pseudomonadota bacterium]|jgi:Rod binding domain-containing protein